MKRIWERLLYQSKQAWFALKSRPTFVFSVVTTMGITLGVLLCVLTLAWVMFIKPLPYPDQDRLYLVEQEQVDQTGKKNVKGFSYPALVDFYKNQQVFSSVALIDYAESSLASDPDSPIVHSSFVTPEWFSLLASKTVKGRVFQQSEAINTFNPVAIISYHAWQNLFDGDENILGKNIFTLNQHYTIIGVLEESFVEPSLKQLSFNSDFILPWDYNRTSDNNRERWWGRSHDRALIGKLLPDYSPIQAEKKSTEYVNRLWQEHTVDEHFFDGWHVEVKLTSFFERIIGDVRFAMIVMIIGAVFLTLIACLNIINLLSARFAQRKHEMAIYAALGSKKRHILIKVFSENAILLSLSLIIALVIASFGFSMLQQYLTDFLPRVKELSLQPVSFFLGAGISLGLSYLFSVLLVNTLNFKKLATMLSSASKGIGAPVNSLKRQVLVVSQVGIALVLVFLSVIIGGAAVKTVMFDDGMNTENLLSLQMRLQADVLPTTAQMNELVEQARLKLSQLPEVKQVSRSSSPLLANLTTWSLLDLTSLKPVVPEGKNIDQYYFSMSGQRLLEGDDFSAADVKDQQQSLIINDVLANMLSEEGSVIGRKLSFGTASEDKYAFKIVGVVSGHKISGQQVIPPRVYRPSSSLFTMMIELESGKKLTTAMIKTVFKDVSLLFKIYKVASFVEQKNDKLFSFYITIFVSLMLMLLTILLASIGLYGVLSYTIQMRRFEIGTRLSIGAKRLDIVRLMIKSNTGSFILGLFGSVIVIFVSFFVFNQYINNVLNMALFDVVCFYLLSILFITTIAIFACYLPLRQYLNKPAIYSLKGGE
jgi:predicted permease